ncbi:MAG: photosynthetic complex assembly protein PuhC [Pseudomonadota bacterium]
MPVQSQSQNNAPKRDIIPRGMVLGLAGLVIAVLALVSAAALTGHDPAGQPGQGMVTAERMILLSASSSQVEILDAEGQFIATLSGREAKFVSGLDRAIQRERKRQSVAASKPLRLQMQDGMRLTLTDPLTGWSAELSGFGASKTGTLARLLDHT